MLSTTFRTCSRVLQRQRPLVVRYRVPHPQSLCNFSTEGENKTAAENKKKDSLRDTVNRLKNDGQNNTNSAGGTNDQQQQQQQQVDDVFRWAADVWDRVKIEVDQTWHELVNAGKPKDINKKIHPVETEEGNREYTGPVEIMVIDESEHLTAWERMQRRLEESPIIQDIMTKGHIVYEKTGAKKVKEELDHLSDDAREAWETSQNPWVYRMSSVYDTLTAESDYTAAVRDLKKLDPDFTLEEWKEDVVEHNLPIIMKWFLEGKINQLKPWLGEAVFNRIAAEITARKQEGVQIDTHILAIMNSEILACEPDEVNKGSPIILLHFMCQQINCVRKKDDGTVVEGSEDDIRANSYVAAFQREYNEERGELNWKIVDFRFNGAIAYL